MIEFTNVVIVFLVGLIAGLIGGAAIHSAWRHSLERDELNDWDKVIRNTNTNNDKEETS